MDKKCKQQYCNGWRKPVFFINSYHIPSYQIIKGNLFKGIFLNVSLPISNVKEFTYTKGIVFGVFGEIGDRKNGYTEYIKKI